MNRLVIAAICLVLQFLYLAGWAAYEASRLLPGAGVSIVVRTVPADPRDVLRGQFMRLRYEFHRPPAGFGAKPGQTVWVVLREKKTDYLLFHEPVEWSLDRPSATRPGDVVIRGVGDARSGLEFGVEKYFVPEGTETPSASDLMVQLRVGADHRPRIENVFLNGEPWP